MGKSSYTTEQHLNARKAAGRKYPYPLVNAMVGEGKKLCILLGARQKTGLGIQLSGRMLA